MRVQIVDRTSAGVPTHWAVLDDDDVPVPQVNRFLAYLQSLERPPNSIRAAAYDLRAFYEFLDASGLHLDDITDEALGRFARWYRAPAENVVAIVDAEATRSRNTTNRALATISRYYRYLGSLPKSDGGKAFRRLEASAATYRRPKVTVIDNVGRASAHRELKRLGPRLPRKGHRLKVLTVQQVHALLKACETRRDRLLILLAFTTGMRIGQILGLRHEDIETRERSIRIEVRDDNENAMRSKGRGGHLPISEQVVRLYIDYMHEEYGYIDSPYVFIDFETLTPMTYSASYAVVKRLRRRTGIHDWSVHTLRHTFVTLSRKAGVPIEVISSLVTHSGIQTTVDMYSHLSAEDLRTILIKFGAWQEDVA